MARMHSRKKGKSGSTKPVKKVVPQWVKYKPNEVELLVVKYAKEGLTPSRIGVHLRDQYGIPDVKVITKKRIVSILKGKKLQKEIPEDMMSLIKKRVSVMKHLEENHKDMTAKRGLQLTESKILRLTKYYKKNEMLPKDWKYDPSKIKLYLE